MLMGKKGSFCVTQTLRGLQVITQENGLSHSGYGCASVGSVSPPGQVPENLYVKGIPASTKGRVYALARQHSPEGGAEGQL
jgi:hypothetical protein